MKKILLVLAFIFSSQFSTVSAQTKLEVGGVTVPRTIDFKGKTLTLNGVGERSKMFTELYVQALYLSQLTQDANLILESDIEMAIRIQITSSLVTSKKLSKALAKGMEKSVGEVGILKLTKEVQELENLIGREITKAGDSFNLIYNPLDRSLWIYKNDKYEGKIESFEFKKAFFGIWLSENPVDKDLKDELLGKNN
ncbi:chalcone isomerase family protein [Flavobacterium sp. Fl-77]|uniref:Chalcone isomerase family protein n=1 Tax=Flavobacterium flavipigmentatum TaxID=2893884 RepID=A0AAJ2SCU0_9FLAO|nr:MULTISPECIES: chalcone isomerase family protein [unclassified Flavobacterium]MDX6182076.1 chalcone isomerase family protein [Flavobacterium sp. Fl-33]MDX6186011.1 chalcone isomerase family protein [Flavobacterium sp. Fl-77]UFH39186.1 chalcone isomerase family protein [Flavobacterium sp. F-70]